MGGGIWCVELACGQSTADAAADTSADASSWRIPFAQHSGSGWDARWCTAVGSTTASCFQRSADDAIATTVCHRHLKRQCDRLGEFDVTHAEPEAVVAQQMMLR